MDERQAKLQQHRLRMTSLTIVNTLLQSVIMGLYAWSGAVSVPLVAWFTAVSLGSTTFFTLAVARHWNLRFPDQWLLFAQLAAQVAIMMAFLALTPQVAPMLLISLLVTFNFAMVSFTPRQFSVSWITLSVLTAAALWAGRDRLVVLAATPFHLAVLWLFFVFAMRRLSLIGTQFSKLRHQLSLKNAQLTESLERINELATHDELTGAFNRRRFMEMLAEERQRAERTSEPFCVAIFDLDHFKHINDRFGHLAGDKVLRRFCDLARETLRGTDRFARYGGEEFVLLMPATTPADHAGIAVERIRAAAEQADWQAVLPGHAVTTSAGVAAWRAHESVEELLARADAALYAAKHAGRNRLAVAE